MTIPATATEVSELLRDVEGVLCDMDGVIYRAGQVIPRAPETVAALRAAGKRVLFCTNNSSMTVGQYIDKLSGLGITAGPEDILTSSNVAAEVLAQRGLTGSRAIVVGQDGVRDALTERGIEIDDDPEHDRADLVVVGWDVTFDFAAMRRASTAVREGAVFVATNDDATFPHEKGLWPGAGSILVSIERASGSKAEVMGKPHAPMMDEAARRMAPATRIAVVGDRPDTDLAGGVARGWPTILVLSGVTSRDEVDDVEPKPDLVVDSIAALA